MAQPIWSTAEGTIGTYTGGSTLSYQLVAIPVSPATSVRYGLIAGTLPPGIAINSFGLISGNIGSVSNTIQYNFTIRATDNLGKISDRAFSITIVVAQPIWNTPAGNLGGFPATVSIFPIQLQASAVLPATSITFNLISGSFPVGITMTSSGLIQGTPETVYENTTYNLVIRATDNLGHIKDRTFNMVVSGIDAPAFTTPTGNILTTLDSTWVELQVEFSSPVASTDTIVRLTQGKLPPGLEINEFGLIRGYAEPPYVVVDAGKITTASISTINNTIVCYSTKGFAPGRPVIFSGIMIGGIVEGFTYYIKSVIDSSTFTISTTVSGEEVELTDAVGYMSITLPNISTGQPTIRTYEFTLRLDTLYGSSIGTYAITVINQTAPNSIGGPGLLANTRIPTILNTRPLSYNITTDPLIYSYYAIPKNSDGNTYPPNVPADIGTFTSNNMFSYKILGYDFDGNELEYEVTDLTLGLTYDATSGWITGNPIISSNSISQFGFKAAVKKKQNPEIISVYFEYKFTLRNAINGDVIWLTDSDLGIVYNNSVSVLSVEASSDVPLLYDLTAGNLPPNLTLLNTGELAGTIAFQPTSELLETGDTSSYTFTVNAFSPQYPIINSEKTFTLTVSQLFTNPMDTLYIKCTPSIEDRQLINSLLTDDSLIPTEYLYRPNDLNFGKATAVIYNHAYGINANNFDAYINAVTKNHYWRNITLGQINTAVAINQYTGEIVYEVVYSLVYDNLVNYLDRDKYSISDQSDLISPQGTSISKEVIWPRPIPLPNNETTSIVYPASLPNMRQQVVDVLGQEQNTNIFPLWMTSQQLNGSSLGFVPAWVICYTKPGYSEIIQNNIKTNWKDVIGRPLALNMVNFKIDRFTVDKNMSYNYNTAIEPPAWSSLPSATPQPDPIDSDNFYVWFPQQTILPE